MYYPPKEEFRRLADKGSLIPVYREIFADLETPVSAFLKLSKGSDYAYLLESVEGPEKIARFSFLCGRPEAVITIKNKTLEIKPIGKNKFFPKKASIPLTEPLLELKRIMSVYRPVDIKGIPRFYGGLVGYFGYDIVRFFEDIPEKFTDSPGMPECMLMFCANQVIFDHFTHKIKIISCACVKNSTSDKAYQGAVKNIEDIIRKLSVCLKSNTNKRNLKAADIKNEIQPLVKKSDFLRMVKKAKYYIKEGDIIQVVLSQKFKQKIKAEAFDIYRRLRSLNPSAYMFYLKFGVIKLAGSSPEMLVRCENRIVTTRPIAGTRPRTNIPAQDKIRQNELLSDKKERAEHIMLLDLGRNDLGRICEFGSLKITEFMRIESYSHVMHIVSEIKGRLKKGYDIYDCLRAAFPAGTVTGSPKIRAMEIIDELENFRRGPYAGCVGYISFSGNLDTGITIRTIVIDNDTAYVQAGAGIVADSAPEKEYQETINKAKAQFKALELGG